MMNEKELIIELPESISLNPLHIQQMQMLNPAFGLSIEAQNIKIVEGFLHFSEMDFFELLFPFEIDQTQFDDLSQCNASNINKLEYNPQSIFINMGTIGFISAFLAAILISLGVGNRKFKLGKTFDAQGDYILTKADDKTIRRIPDISFIAFKNLVGEIYNEKGFIQAKPYFIIEVISNKNSLQQDLNKMAFDWMPAGTEIGLVVCPYREEYYLFEKGKAEYKTVSFSQKFTHQQLPDLEIDFAQHLKEAKEEFGQ